MTRWMWGAVVLASGCVIVEDDDKTGTDTGGGDTDTGDTEIPDPDDDGDGVTVGDGDCNDQDPLIFPGAVEVCDTIDNNCNDAIDDEAAVTLNGTNYATVDEAIAVAVDGDTLAACPGTWTITSLVVTTNITVQAVGGRDVTTLSEVAGAAIATINDGGSLTLDGFTLTGSVESAFMLNEGTLNLRNSRVTGNGRGIEILGNPSATLAVEGTDIDNNAAANGDGGGILAEGVFDITLAQSNIATNSAANGGGIFARVVFGLGTINLVESNITGNNASIGGGVVLQNVALAGDGLSSITGNTADTAGGGVALYKGALESVLVSTNDAPAGGGVAALFDSDFILAPLGNAMTSVIIDSNTASMGAGIWVDDEEPFLLDAASAVTVNTAAETGGGAYLDGNNSSLDSQGADFGAAGVNDNAPDDIFTSAGVFTFEPGAVFACDGNNGCEEVVP